MSVVDGFVGSVREDQVGIMGQIALQLSVADNSVGFASLDHIAGKCVGLGQDGSRCGWFEA
jgi:hypothetical protein